MEIYRGMDRAALDVAYSNRSVVANWQRYLDEWTVRGETVYERATARDLKYGAGERQRMDLFLLEDATAPTCLFLHGGYWQWNDKEGQAIAAGGLLGQGFNAVIGEYSLAPGATMTQICGEAIAQVQWLSAELARRGRDGSKIYLTGISTGAHLMALAMGLSVVRGALLISGIYDLEPIRVSSLNDAIKMDQVEARTFSPLHNVPQHLPPMMLTHGALEIPEIRRQTMDFHAALTALGHEVSYFPVPNTNHFSVLETLSDPDGFLAKRLGELVKRTR